MARTLITAAIVAVGAEDTAGSESDYNFGQISQPLFCRARPPRVAASVRVYRRWRCRRSASFSFDQDFVRGRPSALAVYAKRVEMAIDHGEKVARRASDPAVRNIGCAGCAPTEIKGERGRRTTVGGGKKSQIKLTPPDGMRYVSDEKPVNLTLRPAKQSLSRSPMMAGQFPASLDRRRCRRHRRHVSLRRFDPALRTLSAASPILSRR